MKQLIALGCVGLRAGDDQVEYGRFLNAVFSTKPKAIQASRPGAVAAKSFQIFIQKAGQDDKLGMDVKHIDGKLEVVKLFPDGAIARSNKVNQAENPPGETLQLGDIIYQVNNVDNGDQQMVAECRWKNELNLLVYRTGRAQNSKTNA